MENYVAQQLSALGASALLGAAAGLVYDLLRALRLRRRGNQLLTHLADTVYVLLIFWGLFHLALTMGAGELRLYMMIGALLGAVLYFWLPSRILRPLWDFWLSAASAFFRLLWRPVDFLLRFSKKVSLSLKKHFSFFRKYSKIKMYLWKFAQMFHQIRIKGGMRHGKNQKKTEKQQ